MARAILTDRTLLGISGPDRVSFLQGLVSNDVTQASETRSVWAALLSPRGRYKADFFITAASEQLLLDIHTSHLAPVAASLKRYALRARIEILPINGRIIAGWDCPTELRSYLDPRLREAGWRKFYDQNEVISNPEDILDLSAYESHCLKNGLPVHADFQVDETLLLEANFDCLNGISWEKGCYTGQEVTARMRYRGGVKKRLVPIMSDCDALPPIGTILMTDEGDEAGEMRSAHGGCGMALLRRDYWQRPFKVAGRTVTPQPPEWFPAPDQPNEAKPT